MTNRDALYIDGSWIETEPRERLLLDDPSNGERVGSAPCGTRADADRAVSAALRALPGWSATPVDDRVQVLRRIAAAITARCDEIARLITAEVGTPIADCARIQIASALAVTETIASAAPEALREQRIGDSTVVRQPAGVAALLTPWNYPLYLAMRKIAPALAAGCPVVVKASERAPLSLFLLADIIHELDLPRGVFNLITGRGADVGAHLVRHPLVDKVSYTGSTAGGRAIVEAAAKDVKRLTLELGGKSATVLLEDADMHRGVQETVTCCFLNAGQSCRSWTRLIVPRFSIGEVTELAVKHVEAYRLGSAHEPETTLGPLVSQAQRDAVRGFIDRAASTQARLATGGCDVPADLPRGNYVRGTVFTQVSPNAEIAQEEIFGPVLAIIPYDSMEEAIEIANGTRYGLHGAVYSADPERAERVARRLRTGQVDVNGWKYNPLAPFGGFKQSGWGREFGVHGIHEYTEVQAIQT